jgi:hypothetical protein
LWTLFAGVFLGDLGDLLFLGLGQAAGGEGASAQCRDQCDDRDNDTSGAEAVVESAIHSQLPLL